MSYDRKTQTICPICNRPLNGEYIENGDFIFFTSSCPEHGTSSVLASEYTEDFNKWMEYQSVNVAPKVALTNGASPKSEYGSECPLHCGTCNNHLMTACCVLLDITERCNQHCPWCFANADESPESDPPLDKIASWYDRLIELGEERPFNIQLSGGEPTVRNDLPEIIKMGRERGFEYIQLNTNGKRLGQDFEFTQKLAEAGLTTVFLQFDGMNDEINKTMRGEALLDIKKMAIENCKKSGIPVTLVPTVLKDVNLNDIGNLFDFMIENVNVIKGIHFQPASFFGRHPSTNIDESSIEESNDNRVTMFSVMREIEKQTKGKISRKDLIPISTGHPLCCFCSSFLLEKDKSITSLLSEQQREEGSSCCCGPEPEPIDIIRKDRDFVLNKWTVNNDSCCGETSASCCCEATESEDATDDCCCDTSSEEDVLSLDEALAYIKGHMFTISGMAFMDETNLDAERLKRCRVQFFTEEEKLIPFCSYNSLYR